MNLELNFEGFENYLLGIKELFDGVHYMFRFENGYGASIVKHMYSYGHEDDLWELAVTVFPHKDAKWSKLCYNTPITDDVLGSKTDDEIREILNEIKELDSCYGSNY